MKYNDWWALHQKEQGSNIFPPAMDYVDVINVLKGELLLNDEPIPKTPHGEETVLSKTAVCYATAMILRKCLPPLARQRAVMKLLNHAEYAKASTPIGPCNLMISAPEAVELLQEELLEKNWYIVDPVSPRQSNVYLVHEILWRYSRKFRKREAEFTKAKKALGLIA